ncbi:MAG: hypothetical protein ACTSRP_04730 [Candidatus Helarchaeota archaeon]
MTYEKIKAILEAAEKANSFKELIDYLTNNPAFRLGKNKRKVSIKNLGKQYINKCIKLGLLDENYRLTELGKNALQNYDEIISKIILNLEYKGLKFQDLLLRSLSAIKIPTVDEIREKFLDFGINISINELRLNLNILAKSGILQRNRKYTYSFKRYTLDEFEKIIENEYDSADKDISGLVWFENFKSKIIKNYNMSEEQFDELFKELKQKKPGLLGLQRSRTKTWLIIRK